MLVQLIEINVSCLLRLFLRFLTMKQDQIPISANTLTRFHSRYLPSPFSVPTCLISQSITQHNSQRLPYPHSTLFLIRETNTPSSGLLHRPSLTFLSTIHALLLNSPSFPHNSSNSRLKRSLRRFLHKLTLCKGRWSRR